MDVVSNKKMPFRFYQRSAGFFLLFLILLIVSTAAFSSPIITKDNSNDNNEEKGCSTLPSLAPDDISKALFEPSQDPNLRDDESGEMDKNNAVPFSER